MNVLTGFGLYLLGAFALIVLALFDVLPTIYLGGFVIAGFIGGLFFAWLNAWRQGENLLRKESPQARLQTSKTPVQAVSNYPCMKQIIEGTNVGQTCVYSGGCEKVVECIAATATVPPANLVS